MAEKHMTIPGPALTQAVRIIQAKHNGILCQCRHCQATLISAFAQDMTRHNDGQLAELLELLAYTAFKAWTVNQISYQELIKQIALLANPDAKHTNIDVKITPLTDEEMTLWQTPPKGTA